MATADPKPVDEAHPLFCHQDFLQKLKENENNGVGKRASLLLERLVVDPRREFYKSTQGINKGWRRSRLGGNGGSHFYAWWAPKGATPLRGLVDFEAEAEGAVFLRDIRHHDDHSELNPQSLSSFYLPLTTPDIRGHEYAPSPLTPTQSDFAKARQKVRIVKGYPGSGKTTALWHAADENSQRSTLYVTYSKDLAALARTHFERFASGNKRFHVLPFARLVRELSGVDSPMEPESKARDRFVKELGSLAPRVLGPWVDDRKALYDEIHAHFVGDALPVSAGRFQACDRPRLPDRVYREQRRRIIGGLAADVVVEIVNTIIRRQPNFHELFFPDLLLAWKAIERLRQPNQGGIPSSFLAVDCIAVDEAQDLTPVEAMVIAQLCAPTRDRLKGDLTLLVAGDEAQTVRATDFEWGWLQDMLHHQVGTPEEFHLDTNLRSPRRIAELINCVWTLYGMIAKQDRPRGWHQADIDNEASDQVLYCAATPGPELDQLLHTFADREGLAIIALTDRPPAYVPKELQSRVLTVSEAKGLDFQAVCILDAGETLEQIVGAEDRMRRDSGVEPLSRRLAVDRLRVAISRPTEHIYFLDVTSSIAGRASLIVLLRMGCDGGEIAPAVPATVLKTLEEEVLDPEERIRLCESDAIQYLEVKPEMAWARAKQAVALLGPVEDPGSIADQPVRDSAHLTQAQVSFSLGMRGVQLALELGWPVLLQEAADSAGMAGRDGLADAILAVQELRSGFLMEWAAELIDAVREAPQEFEPWFAMELATHAPQILRGVEESVANPVEASEAMAILPDVYKLYGVADADERLASYRRQAIQQLLAARSFDEALPLVEQDPDAPPALKAECYEGMGKHAEAAEIYRSLGKSKDALRNYRSIPDFEKALALMRETGSEQAAAESLEWIVELRRLLERRPPDLAQSATAAEKKFLDALFAAQLDSPPAQKPAKPQGKRS